MRHREWTRRRPATTLWTLTLCLVGAVAAVSPRPARAQDYRAQDADEAPYAQNAYRDDDDRQDEGIDRTVARVSYTAGDTSFSRGDDPDDWQDLDLNVPMATGDRVYTGDRGRLELQITGGNAVRLDARTDLTALNMTQDMKQLSLAVGTASFQIRGLEDTETFEVDTPNAAITFERAGEYRIDVDDDGYTQIGVLRGRATVAAAGGQVTLVPGDEMDVQGTDEPTYEVVALSEGDEFDDWVDSRERRVEQSRSYEHVSRDIPGAEDLDDYGRWVTLPSYGAVWTPTTVAAGWSPYYDGHWIWQDPWGWTWVGAEPWGWAPYHYGRWVYSTSRWYWVPVRTTVVHVAYAPALVAFVGGGSGWSVSVGTGYVGWFPLAPTDPFNPWYGRRATYAAPAQVTYVNRVHVTVVNRTTFVNGGFVRTNVVRDTTVVRDVSRGPVSRGALGLVPARGALRVSTRVEAGTISRPARAVKPVVVRATPPPAPLPFERKAELIRESRGTPVTPAVEARADVQGMRPERGRVPVRPAASAQGAVKLNPRHSDGEVRSAKPVPPGRARGQDRSADAAAERRVDRPRAGVSPSPAARPPVRPPERAAQPEERPAEAPAGRPSAAPAGPRPDTPKEKLKAEKQKAREERGGGPKKESQDGGQDKQDKKEKKNGGRGR